MSQFEICRLAWRVAAPAPICSTGKHAGVSKTLWSVDDLREKMDAVAPKPRQARPLQETTELMSAKYLKDRYDVEPLRMWPDEDDRDLALINAVSSLGLSGTVFHLMHDTPDQYDDKYVVLVDAKIVVQFEVQRVAGALPEDVRIWSLAEYRREKGQGRDRILLDRAADAARAIISNRDITRV